MRELQDVANALRLSVERGAMVEVLRKDLATMAPDEHWKLIDELPRVCPGMALRRHRNGSETATYTGIALLEVNNLGTAAEINRVKKAAEVLPMTLLAAKGASGHSVKILVHGVRPDGTLPETAEGADAFHRQLYNVACRTYAAIIGREMAKVDASPRDTFRWTFDTALFYNDAAAPFRIDIAADTAQPEATAAAAYGPDAASPENYALWQRRFTQATAKAWDRLYPDGHDRSQAIDAETLLSLTADEAFALQMPVEETVHRARHHHQWYQMPAQQVRAIVEGAYDEKSRQETPAARSTMQDLTIRLQTWMQGRYDLRYNELANGVEWRANTSYGHRFMPLDSRVVNTMIQEANESGLEIFDRDMKRYLGSTRIRDFNEAHAYLRTVENEWDGKTDYIKQLAERVPTTDTRWPERFHTWFLALVAQWMGMDRSHGNSVVPLLVGAQGCGKSTFGQLLLPPELRDVGYKELVDFSSKQEAERMLTNSLLINLDEFNQISEKTQQGFLKNLIQKTSVKGRRPYSSTIVNLPRYASFIATTNLGGTLADPSGSRRFIVVEIADGKHIDTTTPIPYGAIYAQAQAELRSGRRYWFTADEVLELERSNMRSEAQRPVVQHFTECFQPAADGDADARRMRVGELLAEMRRRTGYKAEGNAEVFLGRWLRSEARAGRLRFTRSGGVVRYVVRDVT